MAYCRSSYLAAGHVVDMKPRGLLLNTVVGHAQIHSRAVVSHRKHHNSCSHFAEIFQTESPLATHADIMNTFLIDRKREGFEGRTSDFGI